jgi:anti-anti-sigma factor
VHVVVESVFDNKNRCLTIRVKGRFDYTCHKAFKNTFSTEKGISYNVDLSEIAYLDSSALGMLLLLRDHAGGDKAQIRLVHVNGDVVDILKIANFHRLFEITE